VTGLYAQRSLLKSYGGIWFKILVLSQNSADGRMLFELQLEHPHSLFSCDAPESFSIQTESCGQAFHVIRQRTTDFRNLFRRFSIAKQAQERFGIVKE